MLLATLFHPCGARLGEARRAASAVFIAEPRILDPWSFPAGRRPPSLRVAMQFRWQWLPRDPTLALDPRPRLLLTQGPPAPREEPVPAGRWAGAVPFAAPRCFTTNMALTLQRWLAGREDVSTADVLAYLLGGRSTQTRWFTMRMSRGDL